MRPAKAAHGGWYRCHFGIAPITERFTSHPLAYPFPTIPTPCVSGSTQKRETKSWLCRRFYLHSKGSFHDHYANRRMRQVQSRAVLSPECATTDDRCNVCSLRMSPYPHMHAPGNMWAAKCSYIRQLVAPDNLAGVMGKGQNPCRGSGRYAVEHWVHAHPTCKPCDLFSSKSFVWGGRGIPSLDQLKNNFVLATAPRFGEFVYRRPTCREQYNIKAPQNDFRHVYNMTPSDDWWGWEWFGSKKIEWEHLLQSTYIQIARLKCWHHGHMIADCSLPCSALEQNKFLYWHSVAPFLSMSHFYKEDYCTW